MCFGSLKYNRSLRFHKYFDRNKICDPNTLNLGISVVLNETSNGFVSMYIIGNFQL